MARVNRPGKIRSNERTGRELCPLAKTTATSADRFGAVMDKPAQDRQTTVGLRPIVGGAGAAAVHRTQPAQLAPDATWAFSLVCLVSDVFNDRERVRRDYRDWLDEPSWSQLEMARQALLTGLTGSLWGLDPLLVGFDWRASAEEIHNRLQHIPSCPLASRDPVLTEDYTRSDPDAAAGYLREAARRSRAAEMALFRIHIGDSFELGFIRADRAELLLADAVSAGYTAATDYVFELVDG